MGQAFKTVAVIAGSPALSAILAATLATQRGLRVRMFETRQALTAYMRLSNVALVVADFDCVAAPADQLTLALRFSEDIAQRDFQVLALGRRLSPSRRISAVSAGIDEVIIKPMSPRYLLERVVARLEAGPAAIATISGYVGPERRGRLLRGSGTEQERRWPSNVVPLFGDLQPAP